MLFKSLTIPHAGFAAQDIDGSFVSVVLMRIGPSTRRESYDLQMDSPRSYGLRGDTWRIQVSLLSADFRPRANDSAGQRSVIHRDVRHYVLRQFGHLPDSADPPPWLRNSKLNWSTLRMSGIFDLRGYIGNLRLAKWGSDKVIEMRSADVRLWHFSDVTDHADDVRSSGQTGLRGCGSLKPGL
jgi:hypothetical protein